MSQKIRQSIRYAEMENIHQKYLPIFESLCKNDKYPTPIQKMMDEFVIGRIGANKGVRAFVFYKLYKLAGGRENISYLLAAIELHLASMYCFNVGADTKLGYDNKEKILTAFESHKIVYQLSLLAIERFASEPLAGKIQNVFEKTEKMFYEGQVLDIIINLYKNIGRKPHEILTEIQSISDVDIWQRYGMEKEFIVSALKNLPNTPIADYSFQRTYKINAAMLESFGEIIGLILNLDKEKITKLKNYGMYFGMGMMIVNDIQDYSLDLINDNNDKATREKNKNDVFSDIKKGKITWPIKFALEVDPGLHKLFSKKLGDENISYKECDNIRKLFMKNGTFKRCVLESAYHGKLANDSISDFENEESRKILLEGSASMCKLSKYIYILEKEYGIIIRQSRSQIKQRMKLGDIY